MSKGDQNTSFVTAFRFIIVESLYHKTSLQQDKNGTGMHNELDLYNTCSKINQCILRWSAAIFNLIPTLKQTRVRFCCPCPLARECSGSRRWPRGTVLCPPPAPRDRLKAETSALPVSMKLNSLRLRRITIWSKCIWKAYCPFGKMNIFPCLNYLIVWIMLTMARGFFLCDVGRLIYLIWWRMSNVVYQQFLNSTVTR